VEVEVSTDVRVVVDVGNKVGLPDTGRPEDEAGIDVGTEAGTPDDSDTELGRLGAALPTTVPIELEMGEVESAPLIDDPEGDADGVGGELVMGAEGKENPERLTEDGEDSGALV